MNFLTRHEGDGDPVLRPERKPATLTTIVQHVERLKDKP